MVQRCGQYQRKKIENACNVDKEKINVSGDDKDYEGKKMFDEL